MYQSVWLVLILAGTLFQLSSSITIDDFKRRGRKNNWGYSRTYRPVCKIEGASIRIPKGASLTEKLAAYHETLDVTGKSLKITYSTQVDDTWTLILKQRYRPGNRIKHGRLLKPTTTGNQTLTFPMSEFSFADLTEVVAITIKGEMTIYEIELEDDSISLPPSQVINAAPSHQSQIIPTLLIDDFSKWDDLSKNLLMYERSISETATIGPRFVSLERVEDYVLEFLTVEGKALHLQHMSFKIQYSASTTDMYRIGLFYSHNNGHKSLSVCDIKVCSGAMLVVDVPVSMFVASDPEFDVSSVIGIIIYGPLVVYRIELAMNAQEMYQIQTLSSHLGSNHNALSFMSKYRCFRNALQLISIPFPFQIESGLRSVFFDAFAQMNVQSFRMDLDVYFKYVQRKTKKENKGIFFDQIYTALKAPENMLFERINDKKKSLRIISNPNVSPDQIEHYRFVGRILGMAILNKSMQMINFVPLIYNFLMDEPLRKFNLYQYFSDATVQEINTFLLRVNFNCETSTMSVLVPDFETNKQVVEDLVENGRNIIVDSSNQAEFEFAYKKWYINRFIGTQARAMRDGLYDVIPRSILKGFDGVELQHIISGGRLICSNLPCLNY